MYSMSFSARVCREVYLVLYHEILHIVLLKMPLSEKSETLNVANNCQDIYALRDSSVVRGCDKIRPVQESIS